MSFSELIQTFFPKVHTQYTMELLGYRVDKSLVLMETANNFPKWLYQFTLPLSLMRILIIAHLCQHWHLSVLSSLAFLSESVTLSDCILFCISLTANDVERLFLDFLAIYVKNFFKFFAHF